VRDATFAMSPERGPSPRWAHLSYTVSPERCKDTVLVMRSLSLRPIEAPYLEVAAGRSLRVRCSLAADSLR